MNFFNYYGHQFDFELEAVCPFVGIPVNKAFFAVDKDFMLPEAFDRMKKVIHSEGAKKAEETYKQLSSGALVVQDPFELSRNVAKPHSRGDLLNFVSFCRQTFKILKSKIEWLGNF